MLDPLDADDDQDQQPFDPELRHVYVLPLEPCAGCQHRRRCAVRRLACRSFLEYVAEGKWSSLVPPAERVPDARTFASLFRMGEQHVRGCRAPRLPVKRPRRYDADLTAG